MSVDHPKFACLIIVLTFCFLIQPISADDIDLLLLAGQSNSVGRATPFDSKGNALIRKSRLDSRVRYYYDVDNTGGKFPADSGQTFGNLTSYLNSATNRQELGHEFGASRQLIRSRRNNLAVIKFAVGGASISRWQPKAKDYAGFLEAVEDGVQELIDEGHNVTVVGLGWLQGESDGNPRNARLYGARLEKFIKGIRSDLHQAFPSLEFDKLSFALVEPAQSRTISAEDLRALETVDAALKQFAARDANCVFIPTSDIDHKNGYIDVIHFNAKAQMAIGERIANGLIHLSK